MEYSSNGKGNLGVTLGAIGTGLGVLQNGLGVLGSANSLASSTTSNYVTKDELNFIQELAAKDSEIADLKAESAAESKMIEVYKQTHSEIAALRDSTASDVKELQDEINTNRREQDAWNASQSVANAQMSAAIATNANSISTLNNTIGQITAVKIPNSSVCPGWGDISITPVNPYSTGTSIV